MSSPELNRLMDQARMRLPGALDGMLKTELFSVMNEFFRETNLWIETVEFNVSPIDTPHHIDPEPYRHLLPTSSGVIVRLFGVWDADGAQVSASMPEPGVVTLHRSPQSPEVYYARVVLSVDQQTNKDGYPQFPDWVMTRYDETILDGLLARMLAQPAKPYSNGQLALVHYRRFRTGTNKARVESQRRHVYGAQAWRFPQSFNRLTGR